MARVSVFFFFFVQKNPSLKKNVFFKGVKVREDWLVYVDLCYKVSKSKKNIYIFFSFFFFLGGGGEGGGGGEWGLSK